MSGKAVAAVGKKNGEGGDSPSRRRKRKGKGNRYSSGDEALLGNPLSQIELFFDNKIRNLEKRKLKLMQYGDKQARGEPLTVEQKEAYSKLDDVVQQMSVFTETRNITKHSARRYQIALDRTQQITRTQLEESERHKLATLMRYQEMSNVLGDPSVRNAFAQGSHGTKKLSAEELKTVDMLFTVLQPSVERERETSSWVANTGKAAKMAYSILSASEQTVLHHRSGAELKSLLDKVCDVDVGTVSRLLNDTTLKGEKEASAQTCDDDVADGVLGPQDCTEHPQGLGLAEHGVQVQVEDPLSLQHNTTLPLSFATAIARFTTPSKLDGMVNGLAGVEDCVKERALSYYSCCVLHERLYNNNTTHSNRGTQLPYPLTSEYDSCYSVAYPNDLVDAAQLEQCLLAHTRVKYDCSHTPNWTPLTPSTPSNYNQSMNSFTPSNYNQSMNSFTPSNYNQSMNSFTPSTLSNYSHHSASPSTPSNYNHPNTTLTPKSTVYETMPETHTHAPYGKPFFA